MQSRSIAIILSSPSGGGKTSISREILASHKNIKISVSITTRKPRSNEKEAIDYYFKSVDDFQELKNTHALLEYAEVYGNFYGTQREYVYNILMNGYDVLFNIDHKGAEQIKKRMSNQGIEVVSIFILPPSIKVIKERLRSRGQDSSITIHKRLKVINEILSHSNTYDYVVINDNFEKAVSEITEIIKTYKQHNG